MGDGTVKDASAVKAVAANNEQPQATPLDQAVTAAQAQALEQAKALGYDDVKFQINEADTLRFVNMTFVKDGKDIPTGAAITLTGNDVNTAEGLAERFGTQLTAAVREKHAQYGPKLDAVVTEERANVTTADRRNEAAGLDAPAPQTLQGRRDTAIVDRRWVRPNMEVAAAVGSEVQGTSNAQKQRSAGDIVEGVQRDLEAIGLYDYEVDRKGGEITMGTKGPGGVQKFTERMTAGGGIPEEMRGLLTYAAANADAFKAAGDDAAQLTGFVTAYRQSALTSVESETVDKAEKSEAETVEKPADKPAVEGAETVETTEEVPAEDAKLPPAPPPEQLGGAKQYAKDYRQLPIGTGQAFTQQLGVLEQGMARAQAELAQTSDPAAAEAKQAEVANFQQLIGGMKDAASSKLSAMANDNKDTQCNAFLMQLQNPTLAGEVAGAAMVKIGDTNDSDDFLVAIDEGLQKSPEFAAGFAAGGGENVVESLRVALLTGNDTRTDKAAFANIGIAMLNNPEVQLSEAGRAQLVENTTGVLNDLGIAPAMEHIKAVDPKLGVELAMKLDTTAANRMGVVDYLGSVPPDYRTGEVTTHMASLLTSGITADGLKAETAYLNTLAETNPQLSAQLTQSILSDVGVDSGWSDNILREMIGKQGENPEFVKALVGADVPEGENALARIDMSLLDGSVHADDRGAYLTFMKTLWAEAPEMRGQIEERLIHQFTDKDGNIRIGKSKADDFAREVIQAFGDDALPILAANPKLNETIRTALGQDGLTATEQATVHQLDFLNFVANNWEDASDRMSLLNSQGPTGTPQRAAIDAQFDTLLQIAGNSMPADQAVRFRERFDVAAPVQADSVSAAYLRAISGDGILSAADLTRAADGLGRRGATDEQLDTVERGTLRRIGENLGVDAQLLDRLDALAGGATDVRIDVPAAPQKPEGLPPFFDFGSIHEIGSGGMGARAVMFQDKDGNFLNVLEQDDGSFSMTFLERPEVLPADAKMRDINAAFVEASPTPIPLTGDMGAFLADRVVATTFRETASADFEPTDYHQTLRNVATQTPLAPGDATPEGIDFTKYNGSGSSSGSRTETPEFSLMLGDATAYVRATKTADGYTTEIAYARGENSAWVDESTLEFRPISEGEANRIRDAVDLTNVRGKLWTQFFGGTQLLAALERSKQE